MGLGIHEINPSVAQIGSNVDPGTQWEADIESNVSDALNLAIPTTPTALSFGQLIKAKLVYLAPITTAADGTSFACAQLIGYGNGFFKNWYAYLVWDAGGAGAAPQGEYSLISAYVSTTGTFTIGAFTMPHAGTDKVLIVHPSVAANITQATFDFNATCKASINTQADTALSDIMADHLLAVTDGASSNLAAANVVDGSIIAKLASKAALGATPEAFDCTTDSLEMLSDKLGAYTGDGGAGADDSVKAQVDSLITTVGTPLTAADIQTEATDAIRDVMGGGATNYQRQATKSLDIATADTTIFNITGDVAIISITGMLTTATDAVACNTKLIWSQVTPTNQADVDLCAVKDIQSCAIGTVFYITGTITDAMIGATGVSNHPLQATSIALHSTTGIIIASHGGNPTGVMSWNVTWIPLSAGATLVAA